MQEPDIHGEIRSLGNWEGGIQARKISVSSKCISQNVGHDRVGRASLCKKEDGPVLGREYAVALTFFVNAAFFYVNNQIVSISCGLHRG